jgi:hypothetical protein
MMTSTKFLTISCTALAIAFGSLAVTGDAFARGGMSGSIGHGLSGHFSGSGIGLGHGIGTVRLRGENLRWGHRHVFGALGFAEYSPCYYVTKLGRVLKVCQVDY